MPATGRPATAGPGQATTARPGQAATAGPGRPAARHREEGVELAFSLVTALGGHFTTELGIDVAGGEEQVERWFLAATLFGTRISAALAGRTFRVLEAAGIHRITQADERSWEQLVSLLDDGGYARYDFRTATRLQALAATVRRDYGGEVAELGRRFTDLPALAHALDALPGWGPVTVSLFLRELRGMWPGASPPLDPGAARAARHLGLLPRATGTARATGTGAVRPPGGRAGGELSLLSELAHRAGLDPGDLEAALVRLSLRHRRVTACPGGEYCVVLAAARAGK